MRKAIFFARIAFLCLCSLLFTASAFAIDVRPEDFGAVVDDGIDDSAAIQAAVNKIYEVGGGTIIFPSGRLNVNRRITFIPANYIGGEVKLKGNRGSVIEISTASWDLAFYGGNMNTWTFEDLIFVGKSVPADHPQYFDTAFVILSNYVNQTNIIRCQFLGIATRSGQAVVYVGRTDARIVDSQFDGSLGQYPDGAVVLAGADAMGLSISRSTFLDYSSYGGVYYSKSTGFVGSWVRVNGGLPLNAIGQRRFVIEDSRFDEAAASAIHMENITWANIRGISVNVSGTTPGKGIYLKNVEHAMIQQSWFGYTNNTRPAIVTDNVDALEITSLKFGGGVFFQPPPKSTELTIRNCPACGPARR